MHTNTYITNTNQANIILTTNQNGLRKHAMNGVIPVSRIVTFGCFTVKLYYRSNNYVVNEKNVNRKMIMTSQL